MRKRRTSKIKPQEYIIPIDVTQLGSTDDPCFGKIYDPRASECKRCGDSEACIIAQQQKMLGKRDIIEKKNNFLDLIEPEIQGEQYMDLTPIIAYMKKKLLKYSWVKVVRLSAKKFNLEKAEAKKIYKTNKDKF